MGLIRENPFTGPSTQFYTIGLNETVLIVGLGNVGRQYDNTRHNIGFACADAFASLNSFGGWIEKKDLRCLFASHTLGSKHVILIKPTTLMNLSGEAVQRALSFYKIPPAQAIVVHDELDLPFGSIRTRVGGGSAGHNGIKSVIQHVGDGFGRVRVGIGPKDPPQIDSADFVLSRFAPSQQLQVPAVTQEVNAILNEYIFGGSLPTDTRTIVA